MLQKLNIWSSIKFMGTFGYSIERPSIRSCLEFEILESLKVVYSFCSLVKEVTEVTEPITPSGRLWKCQSGRFLSFF